MDLVKYGYDLDTIRTPFYICPCCGNRYGTIVHPYLCRQCNTYIPTPDTDDPVSGCWDIRRLVSDIMHI